MGIPGSEWGAVAYVDHLPGELSASRMLGRWLRRRGIDWMPFAPDEILWWEP